MIVTINMSQTEEDKEKVGTVEAKAVKEIEYPLIEEIRKRQKLLRPENFSDKRITVK